MSEDRLIILVVSYPHTHTSSHQEEVNALNRKLQWYAENQHLLDRECESMREKDHEIATLRKRLTALQVPHHDDTQLL